MDENKIREELKYILEAEPENYSKILKLSSELSKFDENNIRFSIDAGIINRLGKELVARHETAVSELVKNSYDADAIKVKLTFIDSYETGGILVVSDDGVGMTKDQLVNGFMRLASSDKIHYPFSPAYRRKRAGQKGIGRFAAQRLGKQLTIVTQTEDSKQALEVTINWDDFKNDQDLMFIGNKIEYKDRMPNKKSGTKLIIRDLRDKWTEAQIKRVYRYASEILQPFPLAKVKLKTEDPGFKLICKRKEGNFSEIIANDNAMFFEHALAEIKGNVDDEGFMRISINSQKLNFKIKDVLLNKDKPYKNIRNVNLRAYYFVYKGVHLSPQVESFINEKAKTQGGIRLYRNGFRVLPYAEPLNDWLGLDASVRRRTVLPTHANINFFGFIEIDGQDDKFEELSSREGLLENDAFNELTDFGYKVLTDGVTKISSERGVKTRTNEKDWKKEPEEKISEIIEELESMASLKEDEQIFDCKEDSDDIKEKLGSITQKLKEAQEEQKQKQHELLEEKNLLRILAGLGLTIGEFIHEIKQFQGALSADIENIRNTTTNKDELLIVDRLDSNIKSINTYTSYFDEAISENIQRELAPIELRSVVESLKNSILNDLQRRNLEFNENFIGYNLFTCPMHKSEWASILFNLYTNARKAIKKNNTQKGKIFVEAGKTRNVIYLEFSDNGIGIPLKNREKIFQAFFTTSEPVGKIAKHHEEMTGTGLGLKIVKDIIAGYGGLIYVKEPIKGYNTTIRIELPHDKKGYKYDV
ncbi:sensor histidine kinase [Campylobacter sp. CCUG 57310]|uniref:sensor histidine kinase n=1 Tax=Campylobacter sp. CCUG 57310 TaxID=2517362 RepID=UPI001566913C|nr:sensor histidine kinase [Campylobacter sp. CCUG 57310]QKF91613.1 signal transduction sensor histidine kinase [Campylobacter sp. CCUG 57310]